MPVRVLVVDQWTPEPDRDSGSSSIFSYLQILARAGFAVTFCPFDLKDAGRHSQAIRDLGIDVLSAPEAPSMPAVIERHAPQSDVIILYRATVAAILFDRARKAAPRAKIVFHASDLHFLRLERQAELGGDAGAAAEAAKFRSAEIGLILRADATIVVSSHEKALLAELLPGARVHHIPILRETPAAAMRNQAELRPLLRAGRNRSDLRRLRIALKLRRDVLFIGSFFHPPNADAVAWFVREVWPLAAEAAAPHKFVMAGSQTTEAVAAFASESIEARGHVPDLEPLFAAARLSVAPLRYGAGVKGKIVSSLSYGVPVVATSIAAEGTGLVHRRNVLVADTPRAMAREIVRLLTDDELWLKLSVAGFDFFEATFSHKAGAPQILSLIDRLLTGGI